MHMTTTIRIILSGLLIAIPVVGAPGYAREYQKTPITSADQLPRRTVTLEGTVSQILADREKLEGLARQLLENLQKDLERFDIKDPSTLASYHATIGILHAVLDEPQQALARVPEMRALESKPAVRLTTGLFLETWAKTRAEVPDERSDRFKAAFERNLAAAYAPLPWADIREHVESNKAQATLMNEELVMGSAVQLQQLLDKTGGVVPEGVVFGLVSIDFLLNHRLPLKEQLVRVLTQLSEANDAPVTRSDIWVDRDVSLENRSGLKPVIIGIWDAGVDMTALPEPHRFVNPGETVDGRDNDGNGFVDDVHGIAYDRSRSVRLVGTLADPTGNVTREIRTLQRLAKGSIDMQAGLRSPEATELQNAISALKRDEVQGFMEELGFYTAYMHGTHVAGIAIEGNPAARILAARMTYDHRQPPVPHTMEMARFNARMFEETVAYFRAQGVKVVNMSWRYNGASIEGSLAVNGVGGDADARKALARKMFDIEKNALYEAIKGAPDILFVCGSGNESNDADFSEYIPASFDLPNLVTVGAVDIEGKRTSFTTEGKSVDFFANGHEILSLVPGGDKLRISGTSMASPQVANLAAKLLAIDPTLRPTALVELIRKGSEPSAEDPEIRLINARKTIGMLQRR